MLADDFRADSQGRRYADISQLAGFDLVLTFFADLDRHRRMNDAEQHHKRPPLAGVVRELERHPEIQRFYSSLSPKQAVRFRQAVGVIVRIVMTKYGWFTLGNRRGSLAGLSKWFGRSERYYNLDDD
ncbi:MAG: hypothetical protein AB7I37_17685 [Pirellulales bacterium]